MAASSYKTLLICISFLCHMAHAQYSNVVFSDQDAIAAVPASAPISYDAASLSPTVADDSTASSDGGVSDTTAASDGGVTASLNVQPFMSVPLVQDTPAVNTFVQSAMVNSMSKTENFIENVIEKRLRDPAMDADTKECLETCRDAYEDAMSSMKKAVEDVKDQNLYKANVDVSAMSSNADTCKECIAQVYGKDDPDFQKFSNWIDGVTNDCLDKITGLKA